MLFLHGPQGTAWIQAHPHEVRHATDDVREMTLGGRGVNLVGSFGPTGEGTLFFPLGSLTVQISYVGLSEDDLAALVGSAEAASEEQYASLTGSTH